MVKIIKENEDFIFEMQGLHKLWSLKSQLKIPVANIKKVHQELDDSWWKGWRAPGTNIPGLIVAGTFYLQGEKNFWDVVNKEKAIVVELEGENYNQLVIEVENPEEAIALLSGQ